MYINLEKEVNELIASFYTNANKLTNGFIDLFEASEGIFFQSFVIYGGKILIMRVPENAATYPGKWHGVAGFINSDMGIKQRIIEELEHQTGIAMADIENIVLTKPIIKKYSESDTLWTIIPNIVKLNKQPMIKLNWEHDEYQWINPDLLTKFNLVDNIQSTFNYIKKVYLKSSCKF